MKKKFGRYSVTAKKISTTTRPDGLVETKTQVTGDIEIGIYIEPMTWREDWLRDLMFGSGNTSRYRMLNVQNQWQGGSDTDNIVTAVWLDRERS